MQSIPALLHPSRDMTGGSSHFINGAKLSNVLNWYLPSVFSLYKKMKRLKNLIWPKPGMCPDLAFPCLTPLTIHQTVYQRLHSLYARRAHGELACTHGDPSLPGCPWPLRPDGQLQDKPSRSPIPPLYLSSEETVRRYVRKCRASKTAS